MNTPDIEKNVKKIDTITKNYKSDKREAYFELSSQKNYLYIFIGVFFLLIIFRPSVIYTSELTSSKLKFSLKKFIIWWVSLSCLLSISLAIYNYKSVN